MSLGQHCYFIVLWKNRIVIENVLVPNAVVFKLSYRVLGVSQSSLDGEKDLIVNSSRFLTKSAFLISHLQSQFVYKISFEQRI